MNTKVSKQYQVMEAEIYPYDDEKTKLKEVHQKLHNFDKNFNNTKNRGFLKLCKKTSLKMLHDGNVQHFYGFTYIGKLLNFIL